MSEAEQIPLPLLLQTCTEGCAWGPAAPTGEDLVSLMSSGRSWWRLMAADVAPWIRSLPDAVRRDRYNRLSWLGRPWDGASDMALGEQPLDETSDFNNSEPLWTHDPEEKGLHIVSGSDLRVLVRELRHRIAQRPELRVALPDHRNVRACLAGPEGDISDPTLGTLTIDFDLGEFVVPLCIEDWQTGQHAYTPMPQVALLMVQKLAQAAANRSSLLQRELRMRRAFERVVAGVGFGAATLWLRMEPLRFDDDGDLLAHMPYVAFDIRLDMQQVWAPHGLERVATVPQIVGYFKDRRQQHARRVARLVDMRVFGLSGWMTDVALALIEERGLNPAEVFRSVRRAGLDGCTSENFGNGRHHGSMLCSDGVLTPYIAFEGGSYFNGHLTLDGNFPAAIEAASIGKPLAAFVDHPALASARGVVERAELREGRLQLHHSPTLVTVEDAERRFLERATGQGSRLS